MNNDFKRGQKSPEPVQTTAKTKLITTLEKDLPKNSSANVTDPRTCFHNNR